MHNHIKSRSDESEWSVPERHNNNNNNYKSDKHGLYSLIGEVLGILKLQRSSSSDDCSGYDNCKNGEDFLMILIVLVIYNSIRAVAATEELGICVIVLKKTLKLLISAVMIMITDGVIGETHQARQIVHRLHERTTSCSFIRVGPYDPGTKGEVTEYTE